MKRFRQTEEQSAGPLLLCMLLGGNGAAFSKILAQKDPRRAERLMEDSLGMFRLAADSPKASMVQWNEYANALNECPENNFPGE